MNRGFRLPRNWELHKVEKMNAMTVSKLQQAADCFNTRYQNVDMNKYMAVGFELYTGFSYHLLLDEKVIEMYKRKEKVRMRDLTINKEKVVESCKYIKQYMRDKELINGYNKLETFCKLKDGAMHIAVSSYFKGRLDNVTMAYLMYKNYLKITDDERGMLVNISNNYRELVDGMLDIKTFIEKIEEKI